MDFEDRILRDLVRRGVRYADIRRTVTENERVHVRNGSVESIASALERAVGVRVLVGNGWGFAADTDDSDEALKRAALRALEVAAASHIAASAPVTLSETDAVKGSWSSQWEIDPFSVPIDRKIDHLLAATEPLRGDARIHQVTGEISSYRQRKEFASTEGSRIEQTTTEMGAGIELLAISGSEVQRRTWPNPFGGDYQARGWELIDELDLAGNGPRIRDEAIGLLTAPKAPSGRFDLIIGSSQLALQVHESCGHPVELDRALGTEISLAGGSFLQPGMLGSFRYGSPLVNLTADATIPRAIGSFGWDDEGVPAQRFHLVKDGLFVNYLTGRDTAPVVRGSSNGTVRAETANRIPMIRMTNISLEPGEGTLEELIADTRHGILVDTNRAWSIDDVRLNFQFGCEIAWEIVEGKIGGMLRNPMYTGSTPDFWRSCDAVAGPGTWRVWGLPNCGKGDPMQTMRVAHGAPAARFRQVEMG
ncbi:MAG TPA: TldD/PmbA family protein [Thermoanaerobaculia bacterium]|nr:TldD/PmbA family protein [Thermoanaerobaculia bacterium]